MPATLTQKDEQLKEVILRFVMGEDIDLLRVRLHSACAKYGKSCKSLYKSMKPSPSDPYLIKILAQLNIHPNASEKNGRFEALCKESKNYYELLKHLDYNGHHEFEYFNLSIDEAKPPFNWSYFFFGGALLTASAGLFFHFRKNAFDKIATWFSTAIPDAIKWLQNLLIPIRTLAGFNILSNIGELAYTWYDKTLYGTHASKHRVHSLFFSTLASTISITAFAIIYLTSNTLPLVSGILFVLSSVVGSIKSLHFLISSYKALQPIKKALAAQTTDKSLRAQYARAENLHQRSLRSMAAKLSVTLLITAAIVIQSFVPPSLIMTISCVAFISLLSLGQAALSKVIKRTYAQKLQENLAEIYDNGTDVCTFHTRALSRRQKNQEALEEFNRERELTNHRRTTFFRPPPDEQATAINQIPEELQNNEEKRDRLSP